MNLHARVAAQIPAHPLEVAGGRLEYEGFSFRECGKESLGIFAKMAADIEQNRRPSRDQTEHARLAACGDAPSGAEALRREDLVYEAHGESERQPAKRRVHPTTTGQARGHATPLRQIE